MTDHRVSLKVPLDALELFEMALEPLGGALSLGLADADGQVELALYLDAAPSGPAVAASLELAAAAAGVPPPSVAVNALPETDWVSESQKSLPAVRAGRFYVYGSHVDDPPPPGSIPLLVEAGAAFGTGRHGTTSGCLIALSDLARFLRPRRVLDMGCGSGLLAMAAARLWPCRVLAVDNDPIAVRVARENAVLNKVASQIEAAVSDGYRTGLPRRAGPFDVICANILAAPLCAMAPDLARCLAPGGLAILSGLLTSQEQRVLAVHRLQGLRLRRRIVIGEWSTLVLAR